MQEKDSIRQFYKNIMSWKGENVVLWVVAGICEIPLFIMMFIPYQVICVEEGWLIMAAMFGTFGAMLYLMPYVRFVENQKQYNILEKLRYLPIDLKKMKKYRLEKLVIFQSKIFGVSLVGQILFSVAVRGELNWKNICYVIVLGFLWPILSCLSYAYSGK